MHGLGWVQDARTIHWLSHSPPRCYMLGSYAMHGKPSGESKVGNDNESTVTTLSPSRSNAMQYNPGPSYVYTEGVELEHA